MSTTWESIEERERHIRGSRTTDVMARVAEQAPEGKTLKEAFAERPFISRDDLKRMAAVQLDGPVISLYLNFTPERLVRADRPVFLSVFSSLRHQALESRKAYLESLPHAQRLAVPEELREIQDFLEAFEPQGARALAIFKRGSQINRVVPLPTRIADHLIIDADPFVEPLEAILEEQHRVLVVDVAKDKTAISLFELGYELPVDRIVEDLPRETHEAFREGKTERHRETHVIWHFKASAQRADRIFREGGCDLVVLAGEDITVKEFEDYLPKALSQRIAGRISLPPDVNPNQRRAALEEVLDQRRRQEEEAAIADLGFYKGRERLAAGLQSVIDAGNLFLVRQLVVREDLEAAGYVCHEHHFLALEADACPFDRKPLQETTDLLDELIEMARFHGVEVLIVSARPELLDPYEGIAAVLVAALPAGELRTARVTS